MFTNFIIFLFLWDEEKYIFGLMRKNNILGLFLFKLKNNNNLTV